MFVQKWEEVTSMKLVMKDVEGSSVKAFLSFIYTDDVGPEEVNDAELIYLADKYKVPGLLELSFKRLPYMDDRIVIDVLVAADRHGFQEIKKEALKKVGAQKDKFINDEYFRAQMKKHPDLLLDIMTL